MEKLLEILNSDPWERLRWLVSREFGVLPGSRAGRALSRVELIRCGAHMVLDLRSGNGKNEERSGNPAFDEEMFERLKEIPL